MAVISDECEVRHPSESRVATYESDITAIRHEKYTLFFITSASKIWLVASEAMRMWRILAESNRVRHFRIT